MKERKTTPLAYFTTTAAIQFKTYQTEVAQKKENEFNHILAEIKGGER